MRCFHRILGANTCCIRALTKSALGLTDQALACDAIGVNSTNWPIEQNDDGVYIQSIDFGRCSTGCNATTDLSALAHQRAFLAAAFPTDAPL